MFTTYSGHIYEETAYGVSKIGPDAGLLLRGSISFADTDNLTVEKKTPPLSIQKGIPIHPNGEFLLAITRPQDDTAGAMTVNVYNVIKVDGTNAEDVFLQSFTVEQITGAKNPRAFIVKGLFIGEGQIKIGVKFAADSGALTVPFALYRLP